LRFEEIYEACADSVYAYLRYRVRDPNLLEDIFQDTFLSVYRHLEKARQADSLQAWVIRIAHRRMVEHFRKVSRLMPADSAVIEQEHVTGSAEPGVVESMAMDELLSRLDAESRTILYGIYAEGLTYRELSEMLDLPEGTVKSKCHYAKAKLKRMKEET